MICADCLALLLEAEPEELEGKGTSVLAGHVRECTRCSAIARQLTNDTAGLATVLAQRDAEHVHGVAGSRRGARIVAWGGVLAAAAVTAMVLARPERATTITGVEAGVARASVEVAAPEGRGLEMELPPVALQSRRFADPVAATPTRLVASEHAGSPMPPAPPGAVAVSPLDGKRAFVLTTRNADVTVVWLY